MFAPLAELAGPLTEATIAARAGYYAATQALASNVLYTGLRKTYPGSRRWYYEMKQAMRRLTPQVSFNKRVNAILAVMTATSALRECYERNWGRYHGTQRSY